MYERNKNEAGYLIYVVLLLLSVAGLLVASSLEQTRTSLKIVSTSKQLNKKFIEAENGISQVLAWMRINSQNISDPFSSDNFYDEFERTTPEVGDNDTSNFTVPTKLKLRSSSDSAILSNDASIATAAFPDSRNLVTAASYNVVTNFNDISTDAAVRVTLLDAIAKNTSKDYGDPYLGNNPPDSAFNPVYRIDSYSKTSGEGVHLYAIVTGDVVSSFDYAIYGEQRVLISVDCDSYDSSLGAYGGGNRSANCAVSVPTATAERFQLSSGNVVYGSLTARNANAVDTDSPYGGSICSDFVSGCPNQGDICAGPDCSYSKGLTYDSWPTYCSSDQGNLTIAASQTLSVASASPADSCWDTVTINPGVILTLDTVDYPYYFNNLVFADETSSQLVATPITAGKPVVLYVNDMATDQQADTMSLVSASTGLPADFRLIYFGDNQSYVRKSTSGTFSMYLTLISPNQPIYVLGNIDFYGSIFAQEVHLQQNTGHGFHYDEALAGTGEVADMRFQMHSIGQYRE